MGREPPTPRAPMLPSEANRSATAHLCTILPDCPPSKLQALTRTAKPPQYHQETGKKERQMKSLKGQVAAENPGPCLQGQRECPEPISLPFPLMVGAFKAWSTLHIHKRPSPRAVLFVKLICVYIFMFGRAKDLAIERVTLSWMWKELRLTFHLSSLRR